MKNKKYGYIALIAGLIVFNAVSLAIPAEHSAAFWIAYSFTNVAFILQFVFWKRAFKNADEMKSKFLGIPIVYVSVLYLLIQLICFTVIVAIKASEWVAIVSSISILGIFCLLIISGEISRNTVNNVEQKINDNTVFIRDLRQQIDCLIIDEKDPAIKAKLQEVADVAKYSDSVSSSYVSGVEQEITYCLQVAPSDENLDKVITLLNKRYSIIKSNKGKGEQRDGN